MTEPNVRWDGVSHEEIIAMTRQGLGPAATETLEARLTSAADALTRTSDQVNSVLKRVDGGEWTGAAATMAAAAMQVLRDFDDVMGHRGRVNTLAASGQSDNVSWVRASVPPVVDPRAAQVPTGNPIDILNSIVDYQHELRLAKEAEEEARRVMREYDRMTMERLANLPPLPPVPQVVVGGGENTITVGPRPGDPGAQVPPPGDHVQPLGDETPDGGDTGTASAPQPSDGPGQARGSVTPPGNVPPGSEPAGTTPSGTVGAATLPPAGVGPEAQRSTAAPPAGGFAAVVDGPDAGRAPLRGGQPGGRPVGQPVGAGPRAGEPGPRGARGGAVNVAGRSARPGATGAAPIGTAVPGRSEDDKDHKVKYGVPGSEIFEPDNDDGLLYDPYRPGSFVPPTAIGDDDDE